MDDVEAEDRALANDIVSTEKMINRLFTKLPEHSSESVDGSNSNAMNSLDKKSMLIENNERGKTNKEKLKLLSMIHDHLKYIESSDQNLSSVEGGQGESDDEHSSGERTRDVISDVISTSVEDSVDGKQTRVRKNMLKKPT